MNPDSEGVIVTEHRVVPKTFLYVGFIFLIILVAGVGIFWNIQNTVPITVVPFTQREFGLDGSPSADTNIYGSIIFTAAANEVDPTMNLPYAYAFTMSEGAPVRERTSAMSEYLMTTNNVGYALMTFEKDEQNLDDTLIQPARFEEEHNVFIPLAGVDARHKSGLTVSEDESYYAYEFSEEIPATLADTNIALHNITNGQLEIIAEAAKPQFVGDEEIMYIKVDGVYRHNLISGTTTLVTNQYQELTPTDDFAISRDGATLVLTIPGRNLISVQWFDETGVTNEIGTIINGSETYHTPIVSEDSRMYAVLRRGAINQIEIRFIEGREVLKTISLDQFISDQVRLTDWN